MWLADHWQAMIGSATAVLGGIAALWRLRLGGWLRNRITVELDLIECRRQSEHREAFLADLLDELGSYRQLRAGSVSSAPPMTPPPTMLPKPSSPPPEMSIN